MFSTGNRREGRGYIAIELIYKGAKVDDLFLHCMAKDREANWPILMARANDPVVQAQKLAEVRRTMELLLEDAKRKAQYYSDRLEKLT